MDAYLQVLRRIENWQTGRVETIVSQERVRRAVVFTCRCRLLGFLSKPVEDLVGSEGQLRIRGEDLLYHVRALLHILESPERFNFADHPESWAVVEESDACGFFKQGDVGLEGIGSSMSVFP